MKEINIADLELLTQGSVWTRSDGRSARYMFTVNKGLPLEMQQKYPELVVYADENDNIFAVPVEDFLGKRKFYNVDPGLETRLGNLLAFDGSVGDDSFTLEEDDGLFVSGTPDSDDTEEGVGEAGVGEAGEVFDLVADKVELVSNSLVTYIQENSELPTAIDAEQLALVTTSYQQFPQPENSSLLHTLVVEAVKGVNKETLTKAFDTNQGSNAIFSKFTVNTPDGEIEVDWHVFVGVFPCVYDDSAMYQVIFRTSMEYNVEQPIDEPELIEETVATEVETLIAERQAETPAEQPAAVVSELVID